MEKFFNGFVQFLRGCMFFFSGMFLISPLVGTICAFFDIKFTIVIWLLIVILSLVFGILMLRSKLFDIGGVRELLAYGVIFIVSAAIYMSYSPVLELRQDPSLYMLKTMNLLNYGTVYKPMDLYEEMTTEGVLKLQDGYAEIQNGTQIRDGKLYTDFYPGGTYFYVMFGMFEKRMAFYGQTVIMMLNALLLYELLKRLTKKAHSIANVVCTIAFMIAPLIVWFGRGSYSEPSALLLVLMMALMLDDSEHTPVWAMVLTILSLYSARIDYVLVMFIAIVLLCHISEKWAAAATVLGCVEVFVFSKTYWIYYDRITKNDMKILRFSIPILIIGWIAGIGIKRFWKKFPEFYRSYFVSFVLVALGVVFALFAFRDNIVTQYQMAEIQEQYIRTYVEDAFDMLFMVFPSVIIIGGLLGLYKVQRDEEIAFLPNAFLMGIFLAYCYFFIAFGNSPQLYWGLRRYYNILIPVLFISFVVLMKKTEEHVTIILSVACLIISANLFFDSEQIVEYKGLDISAVDTSVQLDRNHVKYIFYDEDISFNVSSLLSYCKQEFIPIKTSYLERVNDYMHEKGYENYIYLSESNYENATFLYQVSYDKLGENYGEVPKKTYDKSFEFYSYNIDTLLDDFGSIRGIIYSKGKKVSSGTIYDDGWASESISFENLDIDCAAGDVLIIKRYGYDNYYLKNELYDMLDLVLNVNDVKDIRAYRVKDDCLIFPLTGIRHIESIRITDNTFLPASVSDSTDTRNLGIDIKMIYMSEGQ